MPVTADEKSQLLAGLGVADPAKSPKILYGYAIEFRLAQNAATAKVVDQLKKDFDALKKEHKINVDFSFDKTQITQTAETFYRKLYIEDKGQNIAQK